MIDEFVKDVNKEWLCQLLIHLNISLCSSNNGIILINGNKKIQFIDVINPKDCIMKILFNLCI